MGYVVFVIRWVLRALSNGFRRLGRAPEYVVFTLEGPLPELAPPRPPFPRGLFVPKVRTLRDLGAELEQVARDPRVKGVVLRMYEVGTSTAQLQSLRDLIEDLRAAGKRAIAWSHQYDMAKYYVATACDEILLQHGGWVAALGHERRFYFLADALARVGVEAEFIPISPYKTAADTLTRRSMSEQAREMANWLLDDLHRQCLEGIAQGRAVSTEQAEAIVDGGPHVAEGAVDAGAVDGLLGEEDLPRHLGTSAKPARLATYAQARRRLLRPPVPRPGRCVAVLRIAGDIVDGRSSTPPARPPFRLPLVLSEKAGDLTVVHQARSLARQRRVGAVVVHVDSGGGSATSSEAMAAALHTVAEKKPLVVSMGGVAGSGGYYVATPGARIIAQPGTITGSIGVLMGKIVTAGMLEKILFRQEALTRGKRAGYFSSTRPFTEEERRTLRSAIEAIYEQFLKRVAASRKMSRDEVDAVGGGRVWTGSQAQERGLVDELGGLELAIRRAREAAGLSRHCRTIVVKPPKRLLAPSVTSTAGIIDHALQGLRAFGQLKAHFLMTLVSSDF